MKTTHLRILAGYLILVATLNTFSAPYSLYVQANYNGASPDKKSLKVELISATRDHEKASATVKLSGIDNILHTLPPGSTMESFSL